MSAFVDQFERLQACTTPNQLVGEIRRYARALGFEHWLYALDLPVLDDRKHQFLLGGYPDAWVRHYFANDYLRLDPVIAHCQVHARPLPWPSPGDCDPRAVQARRVFGEAADFGLHSGLSVPIHGLGCSWGLVSFASETPMTGRDLAALTPTLHWFAHCIHESAHIHAQAAAPDPPPHLTTRETECLHWVAAGKTSWEIGRLLDVAERTIVFHLQNASRKLGVRGRHAAIARAIVHGLIRP